MIKLRITGLPDDVDSFLNDLRKLSSITDESKPCQNRNSKFVRIYADIEKRGNENE